MKDKEFLDYCYYHSQTPRHLFNVHDARRLCELAGIPEHRGTVGRGENEPVAMDFAFVEPRVKLARDRLDPKPANPPPDPSAAPSSDKA